MKQISIFAALIIFSQNIHKHTKYVVLLNQSSIQRPIPTTMETFWSDKPDFDTIILQGTKIINRLQIQLDQLKLVEPKSIVQSTFSINNAIIRYADDKPTDTIYTNQFFRFFKLGDKLYEDKNQFFKNKFSAFIDKTSNP